MQHLLLSEPLAETSDTDPSLEGEFHACGSIGRVEGAVRVTMHGRSHVHVPRPSRRGRNEQAFF